MTPLKLAVTLQALVGGLLLSLPTGGSLVFPRRTSLLFFVFHISRSPQVTSGCYRVALNVCGFLFCGFFHDPQKSSRKYFIRENCDRVTLDVYMEREGCAGGF